MFVFGGERTRLLIWSNDHFIAVDLCPMTSVTNAAHVCFLYSMIFNWTATNKTIKGKFVLKYCDIRIKLDIQLENVLLSRPMTFPRHSVTFGDEN